ncbi:MBL fold metallo-hydrolase [Chloroflexota bacterium]
MGGVNEVAENIYLIDSQLYSIPQYGSVYLINEEKKALVDTGPATSAEAVLDGINKAGVRPEEIDYLIITHIHLDHAGGAGLLTKSMPRAQVLVHHRGSRHLVNPAKLVSSVIEAQGEEAMMKNGEVVPIEAARVKPVYDGDTLRLSERQLLQFIDAPGHAPHELCIYETRNKGLFTGDVIGIYIAESEVLLPVTPPPGFDSKLYVDSLEKLMELNIARLYFAHFGVTSEVQGILKLAVHKIKVWDEIVIQAMTESKFDGVAERMAAQRYAELEPLKTKESLYNHLFDNVNNANVAGFIKYYREKFTTEQTEG